MFATLRWSRTGAIIGVVPAVIAAKLILDGAVQFHGLFARTYGWSELQLSYAGGFVRRALLGEIAFRLQPLPWLEPVLVNRKALSHPLRALQELRRVAEELRGAEASLDFHGILKSALIPKFADIRERWGDGVTREGAGWLQTHPLPWCHQTRYAQALGIGRDEPPPIEIAAAASRLAGDLASLETNNVLQASTGFGQGELLVSPLSMALVAASVVNAGHVPEPHLVQAVRSPSGVPLQVDVRRNWIRNAMRPATARTVHDMMVAVVDSGQARDASVPGATVGGKTGTAQLGGSLSPHAWFIGFVETEDRVVAIAVIVEQGGSGGTVAAPIFGQVARAAVERLGGR